MAACTTCRTEFEPKRRDHRFCSAECRLQAFLAKKEAKRQERDSQVRLHLKAARADMEAALGLLEEPENRH